MFGVTYEVLDRFGIGKGVNVIQPLSKSQQKVGSTSRQSRLEWSGHLVHPRNVGVKRQAMEVRMLLAPDLACQDLAIALDDGVHGHLNLRDVLGIGIVDSVTVDLGQVTWKWGKIPISM